MIFLHRSLEMMVDMLSFPLEQQQQQSQQSKSHNTGCFLRFYLCFYLQAIHFGVQCQWSLQKIISTIHNNQNWNLVQQLLQQMEQLVVSQYPIPGSKDYYGAPIISSSSSNNTEDDRMQLSYRRAHVFQKLCQRYFAGSLDDVIFASLGQLGTPEFINQALAGITLEQVQFLLQKLCLIPDPEQKNQQKQQKQDLLLLYQNKQFLLDILIQDYLKRPESNYPVQPLFPTETLLWGQQHQEPLPSHVWNLPKFHALSFLSYDDYLGRNFRLTLAETAYDIRMDLVQALSRFGKLRGWSRMALEISNNTTNIKRIEPEPLGKIHPTAVWAEFQINLESCGVALIQEWDSLGEFDNIFLLQVDPNRATGEPPLTISQYKQQLGYYFNNNQEEEEEKNNNNRFVSDEEDPTFPQRFGVVMVRGATIVHIRDSEDKIFTDPALTAPAVGKQRTFLVALDPVQYSQDVANGIVYKDLNWVVRRHGRENSFKAILETAQQLLSGTDSVHQVLPFWLQPLLLGHGSPKAAHYSSQIMQDYAARTAGVPKPHDFLDFGDSFLNEEHLRESFPSSKPVVVVDGQDDMDEEKKSVRHNYKIRFTLPSNPEEENDVLVEAKSYPMTCEGTGNPIRFTPMQVEAIRSGLSCGLTLVVGPPGTGKTDVAVQIIASLYHSFPTQRTVIITHSNAALNDVFEKVMARGDVPERYLIRLGAGERDLKTDSTHDFTKLGRVDYCLKRRAILLEQVQRLSEALGLSGRAERGSDGAPSYTCESAAILFRKIRHHLDGEIEENSPFQSFFSLLEKKSIAEARPFWDQLRGIFEELSEYRPLEILRSQRQRSDYFLMKQARIIAMTSTHAAIARSHLISLGFQYDNLVVEEAGQMTELDTFVPLLLQKGEADQMKKGSRLKRVCLLGDHNQLPPVIKNLSFAQYSNMDQSMFARLVRFGVPCIELDRQGRTRPEIANLYNWRYKNLGNLDHVTVGSFQKANPGFVHTFQFINVENFQGKGETTPTAFFYQNMGEAEYAVALFQFMVLLGYPPQSISILTTYNGQKELISDVLASRCGNDTPLAGIRPGAVSTVDQYQGRQNDYVLLSLVRTESIGHLRDIRRWVVAVSRARYGLYVLGRMELFRHHRELHPVISQFPERLGLKLVLRETFPTERIQGEEIPKDQIFEVDDAEHMGLMVYQMQQNLLQEVSEEEASPMD